MKNLLPLLITLVAFSCAREPVNPPVNLRVEYGGDALDVSTPRFSWHLSDSSRGAAQSAYQILIASEEHLLSENRADIWNSGKVSSSQSVFVPYDGDLLDGPATYYWTVKVWDQDSVEGDYSLPSSFILGMMEPTDWQGSWIGSDATIAKADSLQPRSVYLRGSFSVKRNIRRAVLYVTGLGSYQFYLNGEKTGDDLLTPGWTDYPQRIQYQVYDVTEQVKKGTNNAGFLLGNGWWSSGLGWHGGTSYSDGPLCALMQLEVEYGNGKKQVFTSDDSWEWHFSPITENSLYHGETYDARLEIDDWWNREKAGGTWEPVDVYSHDPGVMLSAQFSPAIEVTREIEPVNIKEVNPGVYVMDMGMNMTGGVRLNVEGSPGDTITMKFAELLHEDGSVAQENLRSARATDRYIIGSEEPETWEPHFTYHGFRYVEIHGLPDAPDSIMVTGLNYHNAAAETGRFACSNELLNTIQRNIGNGQRSNMFSVPTDCPQRDERLGWMGDAQVFAATSMYNMEMSGFYAKWVRDIADGQSPEGWVTDVNPPIVVTDPAKPAWGDAFLIVPREQYGFYRDRRILESYYDDYKGWVEYMASKSEDGLYIYNRDGWGGYGDWIAVVESPKAPISAAYYYYSTRLLAQFAEILGYEAEFKRYQARADKIREAFNERFFDASVPTYTGDTQTALLLPLSFGLVPREYEKAIAARLAEKVESAGYHPSTGFLGTKYLLPTLSDYGYHDIAWKTAVNNEYPSWGYMVENGATSIWELWNSDTEPPDRMNSRNHFALGSVGEWYYSHLAGIRPDRNHAGYKHSFIAPMPAGDLNHASARTWTPYGTISTSWVNENGRFSLEVTIPPNTTSTLCIPVLSEVRKEVYEGGTAILKDGELSGEVPGVGFAGEEGNGMTFTLEPGTYTFDYLY